LQLKQLLVLSFVSALLSYLGIRIEALRLSEALTIVFLEYSPGVFFGALVLASKVSGDSGVWWRRIRLMIASVLIYHIALDKTSLIICASSIFKVRFHNFLSLLASAIN